MKRKRFTEEQIIGVLKEHELGAKTADLCRKHGISKFYNRKSKFGGMDLSEARRLKQLADENGKLKKLLPDAMLDNAANAYGPFCDQPNSTQAAPNDLEWVWTTESPFAANVLLMPPGQQR